MATKRRKLDRSAFQPPPPSADVPPHTGEEFLPVDDMPHKIISHTWLGGENPIFDELERQTKYLCWAYILVDWLQALYRQKYGRSLELSLQELVDNADPTEPGFSYVFDMFTALKWIEKNEISSAEDYPLVSVKQSPRPRKDDAEITRVKNVRCIKPIEHHVLKLLKDKPVPTKLRYDRMTYYALQLKLRDSGGVYRLKKKDYGRRDPYNKDERHIDHAILIVGWGTDEDGTNYYEVRDCNKEGAPNNGIYRVVRPSSLQEDEIEPIAFILTGELE